MFNGIPAGYEGFRGDYFDSDEEDCDLDDIVYPTLGSIDKSNSTTLSWNGSETGESNGAPTTLTTAKSMPVPKSSYKPIIKENGAQSMVSHRVKHQEPDPDKPGNPSNGKEFNKKAMCAHVLVGLGTIGLAVYFLRKLK